MKSSSSAGNLVVTAQMTALCICVRAIFSLVPFFNPVLAVIALCGLGLGPKKGFVIGMMTAFVSNFFFGQGYWTIFQMASWGMAGGIFGLVGFSGMVRKSEWKLSDYIMASVISIVMVICVCGPVMDLSSFVFYEGKTWKILGSFLAMGFIFNVRLAASTVVALLIMADPFLFILDRWTKKARFEQEPFKQ